jgi:quercetin dioxygenase-like cupin family protein
VQILPKQPTMKAPAEAFTGDAWYDVIARGSEPSRLRVNVVRFAPAARDAWHSHARGQTLHVTEGIGLIQSRGGQVTEIRPGDTIHTPPGEWHWHGATRNELILVSAPDRSNQWSIDVWEAPASRSASCASGP